MKNEITSDQRSSSANQSAPTQQLSEQLGCVRRSTTGFTLIELLIVVAILSILATIAFPLYKNFIGEAQKARTMTELRLLESEIYDYFVQTGNLPANLTLINRGTLTDPWGNGYVYSTVLHRRVIPLLNTDFDLYSKGEDGATQDLVYAAGGGTGNDDVVRLADGAYIGTGAGWAGE